MEKPTVHVYDYKINSDLKEKSVSLEEIDNYLGDNTVSWISIITQRDKQFVEDVARKLKLDPLTVEDILNDTHRTKFEQFDDYAYFVLKGIKEIKENNVSRLEKFQISIILTSSYVVSFIHDQEDLFNNIVKRLQKNPKGKLRLNGTEFLCYSLIDEVVDSYLTKFNLFDARIEEIDVAINSQQFTKEIPNSIYQLKREITSLRRSAVPLREASLAAIKSEVVFTKEHMQKYLRDLMDHITSSVEILDNQRENLAELLDLYHTYMNNRMNEIMKVLTIMSSIFIPLSFLVGLYGMNFVYIPELNWRYGYFYVLGLGATIVVTMITFFKLKKWF